MHLGQQPVPVWLDQRLWSDNWTGRHWREILAHRQDEVLLGRIQLSTHQGRPLATDSFLAKLEGVLNRWLRPLPVGRPKKRLQAPPVRKQQEAIVAGRDKRGGRRRNG